MTKKKIWCSLYLVKRLNPIMFNWRSVIQWYFPNGKCSLSKLFFCWHAIQLVFLPLTVSLRGKWVVYCYFVNLWSMSMASPFWIKLEANLPTLAPSFCKSVDKRNYLLLFYLHGLGTSGLAHVELSLKFVQIGFIEDP